MGLLLISGVYFRAAYAYTDYVGADDAEFDTCTTWGSCYLDSGDAIIHMDLTSNVTWYDNSTGISLQYNPDEGVSNSDQKDYASTPMWFQAVIAGEYASNNDNCIEFYVEIWYDSGADYLPVWDNGSCIDVQGAFLYSDSTGNAAVWYMEEETDSSGYIDDVCYQVTGGGYSGGGNSQETCMNPISEYSGLDDYWLRSNPCLCGGSGSGWSPNIDFTAGSGQLEFESNVDLYGISPPIDIATGENSNMEYGCLSSGIPGSGNTDILQDFSLSDAC